MSRFLTRATAVAAATVLAAGALAMTTAPGASAATGSVTFAEAGPFNGGDTATVSFSGFAAGTVTVAVCAKATSLASNCTTVAGSRADIVTATGAGSASIALIKGDLGGTASWSCGGGAGHECNVVAFQGATTASKAIVYALTITSATPAGPYVGGETVTLKFSGAGASQTNPAVIGIICDADIPYQADGSSCDFATMVNATVDAAGNGTVKVPVVKGALPTLPSTCGTTSTTKCSIVVTDVNGRLYAAKPVSFGSTSVTTPSTPSTPSTPVSNPVPTTPGAASQTVRLPVTIVVGRWYLLPKLTTRRWATKYTVLTPATCAVARYTHQGLGRRAVRGTAAGACKITVTSRGNYLTNPMSTTFTITVGAAQ